MKAPLTALVALSLLPTLCACTRPAEPAARTTPVAVVQVTEGPDHPVLQLHGVIANRDELRLAFKVGGVIERISVEAGVAVHAGQLLAQIEPAEIDAQQAQARELDAKAARDLERGEKLYADEVLSLEQLQNLRTQRQVAAAQLRAVQFNRQYARIAAPADGVVLYRLASAHEQVSAGQAVLVVSSARRGYVLRAAVADRELPSLKLGLDATVTLDAAPGALVRGSVTEVSRAADSATGLFPVEITLVPVKFPLASGMVASARLQPGGAARLVRIPAGALVSGEGTRGAVFVLQDGRAHRRAVGVAFIDGAQLALSDGLRAGDTVITDGAAFLDDGEQVVVSDGH